MPLPSVNEKYNLSFTHLPGYAGYLLDHCLDEYVSRQLEGATTLQIPLLEALRSLSTEQLRALTEQYVREFLTYLRDNKAAEHIETGIARWRNNELPHVDKFNINTDDIFLVTLLRKKNLLHFLPRYVQQPEQLIRIVEEIDELLTYADAAGIETYLQLLREKINDHSHFITKIAETLPGAVYLFDVERFQNSYANRKLKEVFGYSLEELNNLGPASLRELIHEEDQAEVRQRLDQVKSAADGEVVSYQYRLKKPGNDYRWIQNHESVFKRNEAGQVIESIAFSLDVHEEKETARELSCREEQLLEAQELARLGSFTWTLQDYTQSQGSPQLFALLELPGNDHAAFLEKVHPEDREGLERMVEEALRTGTFNYEFRYGGAGGEKRLWSRGKVLYNGTEPVSIHGSLMDVTERQDLLQRLQKGEVVYKQAEELGNMGNWSWDLETDEVTWTDQLFRIYGLEPQSELVTLERFLSFVHPEDRPAIEASIKEHPETDFVDRTFRIIAADGTIKTLRSIARYQTGRSGNARYVIGTEQDVSEQVATEAELRDKQNFIQKIADAAPSIITSFNVNTSRYAFVNEGLKKILGFDTSEIMQGGVDLMTALIHPEDVTRVLQENYAALERANADMSLDSAVYKFNYRIRHKDGNYRWVNTFASVFDRNAAGRVEHVLKITVDVTEHREAMQKIEEQEFFIKQLADASPTILYIFDTVRGCFSYINHEIYYVSGFTPEEITEMEGDTVLQLYHPDDRHLLPERKDTGKKFQHFNSMIQYECRIKNKSGDWCWVLVREVIFKRDGSGLPTQILGAALDITKRKEMEKSLLHNAFQLEQSNASLEEFAYVASHDLKEPLRKISTFGDRMMQTQESRLSEDGKIYLKKIVDASQRMQLMINDLLSISMISGDRSFQSYSLQLILEDVKQTLEYKIEKKGARIESPLLPEANIVPSQFRQLFQNLLSNSLKFIPDDRQPEIRIRYEYVNPEQVSQPVNKAPRYLKLDFEDNGIGFEEEYAAKIFQIFQRLHGRSEYEGTGIGLAICKKIVEHHGGAIYATGEAGKGAIFTLILPA